MTPADITNKLWNYCHVLRDDAMSYGDYVEQLTYLLFLKMADERSKPPYAPASSTHKYFSPIAAEIVEDLEAALEQFREIATDLEK